MANPLRLRPFQLAETAALEAPKESGKADLVTSIAIPALTECAQPVAPVPLHHFAFEDLAGTGTLSSMSSAIASSAMGLQVRKKQKAAPSSRADNEDTSSAKPAPSAAGFEDVGYTESPKKSGLVCPSAPKKAKPSAARQLALSSASEPEEDGIEVGKPFNIQKWIDRSPITLVPIKKLGSGAHGTAWLVRMPDGSHKVYKVDEETNFSYIKEELYQYAQLREIGFPVAIHYDLESFIHTAEFKAIYAIPNKIMRDQELLKFVRQHVTHGYHLRQYVEHKFPSYETAPPGFPLYDQVEQMMKVAYQYGIAVDLQRANVGYVMVDELDPDGGIKKMPKVLYFDLMPHDEVDLDAFGMQRQDENPFHFIVKQCLKTFAPVGHPVYVKLDPRKVDG